MKYRMKLKKQTRHTAVYDTEDPLAPVTTLYVQKSWLAGGCPPDEDIVPPAVLLELERAPATRKGG